MTLDELMEADIALAEIEMEEAQIATASARAIAEMMGALAVAGKGK